MLSWKTQTLPLGWNLEFLNGESLSVDCNGRKKSSIMDDLKQGTNGR